MHPTQPRAAERIGSAAAKAATLSRYALHPTQPTPATLPISDAASAGGYGTRYYTYKKNVPLKPGETIAYTPGKGYYARTLRNPRASAALHPVQPATPEITSNRVTAIDDSVPVAVTNRAPGAAERSSTKVPIKVTEERQPHRWTSPSHPVGPHYTNAQLRALGATADEIWIIDHESGGYTYAWNHVRTPTGYAYGLGQITGLFRLEHFGKHWESVSRPVERWTTYAG